MLALLLAAPLACRGLCAHVATQYDLLVDRLRARNDTETADLAVEFADHTRDLCRRLEDRRQSP